MTPVSSRVSNCSLTAAERRSNQAARPCEEELLLVPSRVSPSLNSPRDSLFLNSKDLECLKMRSRLELSIHPVVDCISPYWAGFLDLGIRPAHYIPSSQSLMSRGWRRWNELRIVHRNVLLQISELHGETIAWTGNRPTIRSFHAVSGAIVAVIDLRGIQSQQTLRVTHQPQEQSRLGVEIQSQRCIKKSCRMWVMFFFRRSHQAAVRISIYL